MWALQGSNQHQLVNRVKPHVEPLIGELYTPLYLSVPSREGTGGVTLHHVHARHCESYDVNAYFI